MRKLVYLLALLILNINSFVVAQSNIEKVVKKNEAKEYLSYLASDKMLGRDTGSPQLDSAANFIISLFQKWGVEKVKGKDSYLQEVGLNKTYTPSEGKVVIGDSSFEHPKNALMLRGKDFTGNVEMIYANYARERDLDSLDIKGKVVVAKFGLPDIKDVRKAMAISREKRKNVLDRGGLGIIELYDSNQIPWSMLVLYMNHPNMVLADDNDKEQDYPFHFFLDDRKGKLNSWISEKSIFDGKIILKGITPNYIASNNVVGYVPGTDETLKNEYVVLSAHYDHIGTGPAKMVNGEPADTIYNGARDNALGTTGLLMAAKYFSKYPAKRSILFIAFTAEEKGLLGSEYYTEHPWVPLSQCVFNLNIDCAGYNDTTKVTVFGLTRNTEREQFEMASKNYGLKTIKDPIPEQNIFSRSDHYNFAKKGIPSVLFSPGIVSFDQEIQKYYHQVTDHVESLNFNYLEKYYKTFVDITEKIANDPEKPFWKKGDEFESVGKNLYEMQ